MFPSQLLGCTACNIVVYCRSGSRSKQAADKLPSLGFTGGIYDGLGINQWEGAGYPLVRTPSRDDPACAQVPGVCRWQLAPAPSYPPNVPDAAPQVNPSPSLSLSLSLSLSPLALARALVALLLPNPNPIRRSARRRRPPRRVHPSARRLSRREAAAVPSPACSRPSCSASPASWRWPARQHNGLDYWYRVRDHHRPPVSSAGGPVLRARAAARGVGAWRTRRVCGCTACPPSPRDRSEKENLLFG